jgi:DedD protein
MEPQLKQRLVGAAVLVSLAVLVVPVLLDGGYRDSARPRRDMAPMPADGFEEVAPPLPAELGAELDAGLGAGPEVLAETAQAGAAEMPPADAPLDDAVIEDAVVTPAAPAEVPVRKPETAAPPAQPPSAVPPPAPAAAAERWAVQLGSFASRDNAEGLLRRMAASGVQGFVLPLKDGNSTSFRVRAGPVDGRAAAERLRGQLEDTQGIRGMLVRHP